ncbi:MAG: ClC family H(+)/Cl(-) exchange transporter [Actinobacteria bacterium]|nr:ClC family H(+)/Cl(-) exchange transporter [Actinomycetota bacterium]
MTGLVGGLFRAALSAADHLRLTVEQWARDEPNLRWLVPVLLSAVAVALARLTVRWVPQASGSGVQRVEATMRSEVPPVGFLVVPAKFVGGVLGIGAGLALGREGPTVQMGAAIGVRLARFARVDGHDLRTMAASLAGAGLGVAFSAPLGGAAFVFEEVSRAFRTRLVVVTLLGCGSALAVAQLIVGRQPVFDVPPLEPQGILLLPAFVLLGALLGVVGVLYNRLIVLLLDLFERIRRIPPEVSAGVVGAAVGLLGVVAPSLIGGGDQLNEELLIAGVGLSTLFLAVLVRLLLGPLSYSLGTPGGLFAPLLLLGALIGALFARLANELVPSLELSVTAFAIVGMSTFFASVVRAPVTGVILIVEMTATTSQLAPMILAAGTAVLVATLMKGAPIYDTLRDRLLNRRAAVAAN